MVPILWAGERSPSLPQVYSFSPREDIKTQIKVVISHKSSYTHVFFVQLDK